MPFFNNFRVSLDPTRGTLVLEEIDINSIEGIYGGLNQTAWRTKFRQVHGQLERVRERLVRLPAENVCAGGPRIGTAISCPWRPTRSWKNRG